MQRSLTNNLRRSVTIDFKVLSLSLSLCLAQSYIVSWSNQDEQIQLDDIFT